MEKYRNHFRKRPVAWEASISAEVQSIHKTSPKSSLQMHWISVGFYEMGDIWVCRPLSSEQDGGRPTPRAPRPIPGRWPWHHKPTLAWPGLDRLRKKIIKGLTKKWYENNIINGNESPPPLVEVISLVK